MHSKGTTKSETQMQLSPMLQVWNAVLTVKHILLHCPALRDVRLRYFTAPSLEDIFESVLAVIFQKAGEHLPSYQF